MNKPLDEMIDLTPLADAPTLVSRGTLYSTLRKAGQSDYIASLFAFANKAASRDGQPISGAQYLAFLAGGPSALTDQSGAA